MPDKRPVRIDVYAEDDSSQDCGVAFRHEWKFEDEPNGPGKSGQIDLPADRGYDLVFHLHDRTRDPKRKLSFACPGENAMWVAKGPIDHKPPCPTEPSTTDQILYDGNCNNDMLKVTDVNSGEPCLLTYTLCFGGERHVGPSGRSYPPYLYDPDIKNGGGNTR